MFPRSMKYLAVTAALFTAACSADTTVAPEGPPSAEQMPTGAPEYVIIGNDVFLEPGKSEALTPVERIARWRLVWWSSSNSAVASVDWRGLVTARQEGSTTVTALSLGGSHSWPVYSYDASKVTFAVTPASPTVAVGATVELNASITAGSGMDLPVSRVTYRSDNSAVATVSNDGRVTGVSRGSTTIRVSALGLARTVTVTVGSSSSGSPAPALLTALTLSPRGNFTIGTGLSQAFTVNGTWSDGVSRPVSATFTATGGTITPQGIYTAPATAGTHRVIVGAEGSLLRDTAIITVTAPTLTELRITPKTVSMAPGNTQQFNVTAKWSNGAVTVPNVTWSRVGGSSNGSVSSNGLYTAPSSAGTYRVIVAHNGGTLRDTAVVTVTSTPPVLSSLSINPKTVTIPTGGTQQFTASAQWNNGSTTVPSVTWSRVGGSSNGSVSSSGLYTAPATAGTYRVIVAHDGGTRRDTATVTVVAPTLTKLTISPKTVTLSPNGVQQFSATAQWSNGSTTVPTLSWSRIGSGSISTSGRYTAPSSAGTYRVIVAHSGGTLRDTATVTVSAPQPTVTSFVLSPGSASLNAGGTRQFSTAVTWSDGASRPVTVSYQATGGSVSVGGLYTAGQVAGTFMVIASCSCGVADTSAVTIAAAQAQLLNLTISPKTVTVAPGATQQFGVSAQWSTGAITLPPVTWSRIGGSSAGSVTSNGLYTAPQSPGTYRVVVAHTGGILRDTAVVTVQGAAPPPPVGGQWNLASNLPAGMTLRSDTHHNTLIPSGWGGVAQRSGPAPSVVTDASDPSGDGNVMRQLWGGVGDGASPSFLYRQTNYNHIYVATIAKISSSMMPTNEVKWLTWAPASGFAWLGFYGSSGTYGSQRFGLRGAETEMRFVRRSGQDYISERVGTHMNIPTDRWVKVQIELRISPVRVRVWIDDVLVQTEGASFNWAGITSFGELQMGSTWGGGNGRSAPSGASIDYGRTVIWSN